MQREGIMRRLGWIGLAAAVVSVNATAAELETARPEAAGMSAERLARLDAAMQADAAAKRNAGSVVLIARKGKIVHLKAYGLADTATGAPMRTDSLFRLYSTTKPMVSVGLMILYEEGRFQLTDPVEKYIPEFAKLQVYDGEKDGRMALRAPVRKPTMLDVMRHTVGFPGTALPAFNGPVERVWMAATFPPDLEGKIRKIAELPLLYDPGEQWRYGPEHDVQAYLIETLSGTTVDRFLKQRLFDPLKMRDTFYAPPPEDLGRYPVMYAADGSGGLKVYDDPKASAYLADAKHPKGGSGLSSTAYDVARFGQMMLNGGELDGVRILSRKTVEAMVSDQLPAKATGIAYGPANSWPGMRYGLGIGVMEDVAASARLGSKGSFGWPGFGTTDMLVDPKEEMVVVTFSQRFPSDMQWIYRAETLVYQSIAD
jgi:CubicO group peptidase (beta-lactamase class C family)